MVKKSVKRFDRQIGQGIVADIRDDRSLFERLLDRLRWWRLGWAGGWIEFEPDSERIAYRLRWWHPSFPAEMARRLLLFVKLWIARREIAAIDREVERPNVEIREIIAKRAAAWLDTEVMKVVDKRAAVPFDSRVERHDDQTGVTMTSVRSKQLTIAELAQSMAGIRECLPNPVLRKIWVVDRPHWIRWLKETCQSVVIWGGTTLAAPIVQTTFVDAPDWVLSPGVWCEMADGNHGLIQESIGRQ